MTHSAIRRAHPLLAVLSVLAFGGAAQAAVAKPEAPAMQRDTLYAAEGSFVLQDGRELQLRVRSAKAVVSFDGVGEQRWQLESPSVLVSPDGRQRLHLHRKANGVVDQVSLESPRAR